MPSMDDIDTTKAASNDALYWPMEVLPGKTGLAKSTLEAEIRAKRFPLPRQLSGRRVGWLVREVMEWAESRPVSDLPPPPNTGAKKPKSRQAQPDAPPSTGA